MIDNTISVADPIEKSETEPEFRLYVPRDYMNELESILNQSRTKFTKSISPDYFGGDHGGYNFDFKNEEKFHIAEAILEDMLTYISSVRYSPEMIDKVEDLISKCGLTILKTTSTKIFGKTVKMKSSIKGREAYLNAFFVEMSKLKKNK